MVFRSKIAGFRTAFLLVTIALTGITPAGATVQFQRVFVEEYLAAHPDRAFVEYVGKQAKCNTCHQGMKDRKQLNAFGMELAKLLDAKADRDDKAKTLAAIRDVAQQPIDATSPTSGTFGERIAAGKLPAGELDDAKREPAE